MLASYSCRLCRLVSPMGRLYRYFITLLALLIVVSISLFSLIRASGNIAEKSLVSHPLPELHNKAILLSQTHTTKRSAFVSSRKTESLSVSHPKLPWPHNKAVLLSQTHTSKKSGYVLAHHYSDQVTAGSVNLLTLQCWAAQLHDRVKVVEPFLHDGSYWGLDASQLDSPSAPRLRDIFDATEWRRYSLKRGLSPLANWEEFLQKSPRNLIIAGLGCKELEERFRAFAVRFAESKGFRIVHRVCTNSETVFSPEKFRSQVYGDFRPADTVVLFDTWSGILGTISQPPFRYRIPIKNLNRCERDSSLKKFMDSIPQSKRILENGRTYIQRYLSPGYIAVMFRLEQLFIRHNLLEDSGRLNGGKRCIESILKRVALIQRTGPTRKVFLAMDSGKYGSYWYRHKNYTTVQRLSHELFSGLYDSMTFDDWESSFASVADFATPGYVAMLQLSVAVHAMHLLLAGGGSFQSIAEREIRIRHQSTAKVYHLKNC